MRQSQKISEASDAYLYRRYLQQILVVIGILLFSLVSSYALANPFATPDDFSAASCPIGHKKYSIGTNASTATTQPLSLWKAGETSRTFNFDENSGKKTFTISFPILEDANNSDGTVPFYGSNNGVTSNAINLVHNSTRVQTDHTLDISVNRPVSKIGYKIQDLDSLTSQVIVGYFLFFPIYRDRTPYIEQVDVSADNGRLTSNDIFHNNDEEDVVTAKEGENCETGECTIDATWGYKSAGSIVNLKHNNTKRETRGSHAIGYSDFYFCLAPPKVIVEKVLNGSRVSANDQFQVEIKQGTTTLNSFITTGSDANVTTNTSPVIPLVENASYTITERVLNGGDISNYSANYSCNNATTGTKIEFSADALTYNAATKTRSFTLDGTKFGDEITCTITNIPIDNYTFTGYMFNDNGGIAENNSTNLDTNTKSDISSRFTGNKKYFNGIFDSDENGVSATGLTVSLTDCNENNITGTTAKTISTNPLGQFRFTVPASAIASKNKVCLVQTEPSSWNYSVDTTPNSREVGLQSGRLDYKTDSTLNLDFGEVKANYASLVLIKSQYVNDCNINANYDGTTGTPSQVPVFSTAEITDIEPGKCIAYKIDAYNRGHVALNKIQISDELQNKSVKSVFTTPFPRGSSEDVYKNTSRLPTGTIVSKLFNLNAPTGTSATQATLYFNTKYGTTSDNNP